MHSESMYVASFAKTRNRATSKVKQKCAPSTYATRATQNPLSRTAFLACTAPKLAGRRDRLSCMTYHTRELASDRGAINSLVERTRELRRDQLAGRTYKRAAVKTMHLYNHRSAGHGPLGKMRVAHVHILRSDQIRSDEIRSFLSYRLALQSAPSTINA